MSRSETIVTLLEGISESALLHEALGKNGAMSCDIKPAYPGAKVVGRAITVRCVPGDNLMLHLALDLAEPGDVLVATADSFLEGGAWGEIASIGAQQKGIVGLVFDGSVRDVDAITRLRFPTFSRGVSIKGTTKKQKGEVNVSIEIGGVRVNPGDIVVGDTDGVVVVPQSELESVAAKAREIKAKEEEMIKQLRNGASTLDLLGLRPVIDELGLNGKEEV